MPIHLSAAPQTHQTSASSSAAGTSSVVTSSETAVYEATYLTAIVSPLASGAGDNTSSPAQTSHSSTAGLMVGSTVIRAPGSTSPPANAPRWRNCPGGCSTRTPSSQSVGS